MTGVMLGDRSEQIVPLQAAYDDGYGDRIRIGLIALSTDHTIEQEWRALLPSDRVALYHSRIGNVPEINAETLDAMRHGLADTASRLLPGETLDAVAYGCTSASTVIGPEAVADEVAQTLPDVPVTTPISALMAAANALGIRRLALITPYEPEVTLRIRDFLEGRGISVPVTGSFLEPDDNRVARITAGAIQDAVLSLGAADGIDGVFVSCTNLRVAPLIEPLENRLGKPVMSSNTVLAWHALRTAGGRNIPIRAGRLSAV